MRIVHRVSRIGLLCGLLMLMAGCARQAQQPAPPSLGAIAPDWTLPLLDGGTLRLAEQRGHVVIVNFWASWCGPCVSEVPRLVGWHAQYAEDGLRIVGIDTLFRDSRETVAQFVRDNQVSYPVPVDEAGDVSRQWLAHQLPRSYVLDREGVVRFMRIGEITERDFQTHVLPLLTENQYIGDGLLRAR